MEKFTLEYGVISENGRSMVTLSRAHYGDNAPSNSDIESVQAQILLSLNCFPDMLAALERSLADLEGVMPEFEPSGDRTHPAWQTMVDIRAAIEKARGSQ